MPKKQKKQKKSSKKFSLYEASKPLKRKNTFCPKCGGGVFMARHKDRVTCGKCGYMEVTTQKKE